MWQRTWLVTTLKRVRRESQDTHQLTLFSFCLALPSILSFSFYVFPSFSLFLSLVHLKSIWLSLSPEMQFLLHIYKPTFLTGPCIISLWKYENKRSLNSICKVGQGSHKLFSCEDLMIPTSGQSLHIYSYWRPFVSEKYLWWVLWNHNLWGILIISLNVKKFTENNGKGQTRT